MTIDHHKRQELEQLQSRVRELEAEIARDADPGQWPPKGYYFEYYATSGFILGMISAAISLLVNVVGAPIVGKSPLELIRIYLTFPLGENARQLASTAQDTYVIGDGVILALGCCLYLGTGMLLGVPLFAALGWFTEKKSTIYRLFVATLLSSALWAFNFYAILSWLQPALFGGHWITDPAILPPWVALVTHLVFGWTLALLYPFARFQPYSPARHHLQQNEIAADGENQTR